MLVIRLVRTGRRNQPKYRIVVAEDRSKLTGKPVAMLGHYIPADKDKPLVVDKEAVAMWISRGAQPSNTMAKVLNGQGFDLPVHQYQPAKPKKAPKEAPSPSTSSGSSDQKPLATGEEDPGSVSVGTETTPGEPVDLEGGSEVAVENVVAEAETEALVEEVPVETVATEEAAEAVETPEVVKAEEAVAEVASDEAEA